ncbi:hypothetical protein [Microcoleus sp. FACHB-68]|uniref:hypothetical protein n=1 Tax=Microcoleus sp. FACHB-68 TaxID=2692826 RepID=UPI001F559DF6|nr:hypothetical protein [Microcoleus sp. FACHB-68]
MTDRVLNRPYGTLDKLQAQSQLPPQLSPLLIKAEIKKSQGVTKVKVKSANPDLKGSVFEVPATEISQIETVIAQKLNISVEEVRQLVRYQIEN